MAKEIVARTGEPNDAQELSDIAARLFHQTYYGKMPSPDLESYIAEEFTLEAQLSELEDPDVTTLLAESDGELVGYVQIRRKSVPVAIESNVPIELWRIYLDKSSQGLGIGKLLLSAAGHAASEMGSQHIWLGVWERNIQAISFYERRGFNVVGSQEFNIGTETHNDLVMVGSVDAF